jgi:hypothetical protein
MPPKLRTLSQDGHYRVEPAVAVQISDYGAAMRFRFLKIQPG